MTIEEHLKVEYEEEVGAPFIDSLTGLFNHGFFQTVLIREIKRSERQGRPFTLALIDIAGFNRFNLKTGYRAGDQLLKELGGIIQGNIRETDLAARYLGDQYSLILVESGAEAARLAALRIQKKVKERYGDEVKIFFGLACFPGTAENRQELLAQAGDALKQAKTQGGDGIIFFGSGRQILDKEKVVILLVDDEPRNLKLLEAFLGAFPYKILKATNGEEALSLVEKEEVDLILLDVMMPGMDGFEVCRRLKSREKTRLIPIVLITALDDLESRVTGMESGADDFISKPINRMEILARVKNLIITRKQNNRLTSIENVLFSLANAVEAKDRHTQGHTNRVASLAIALGKKIGLTQEEIEALRIGGMLHDIGKIGIPETILNKPGPLTDEEWALMKTHCDIGYKICQPLEKNLGLALEVIRYHHEKMDRSGYPDGLAGPQVPMVARVMAVVDIYDSMTTDRPYRKALPRETGLNYLQAEAEKGKLDRGVVEQFIRLLSTTSENEKRIIEL
jgi:putative two-component system response regulator